MDRLFDSMFIVMGCFQGGFCLSRWQATCFLLICPPPLASFHHWKIRKQKTTCGLVSESFLVLPSFSPKFLTYHNPTRATEQKILGRENDTSSRWFRETSVLLQNKEGNIKGRQTSRRKRQGKERRWCREERGQWGRHPTSHSHVDSWANTWRRRRMATVVSLHFANKLKVRFLLHIYISFFLSY